MSIVSSLLYIASQVMSQSYLLSSETTIPFPPFIDGMMIS